MTPRPVNEAPHHAGDDLRAMLGRVSAKRAARGPVSEDPPPTLPCLASIYEHIRMPAKYPPMFRAGQPEPRRAMCVQRTGRVLVLCGVSGAGKSVAVHYAAHTAAMDARARGEARPSVVCASADELHVLGLDEDMMGRLCGARLLVLDDLGRTYRLPGRGQSFGLHVLGRILETREREGLVVLGASQYVGRDLYARLGDDEQERERNWRRLDGECAGAIVDLGAKTNDVPGGTQTKGGT